MKRIIFFDGVCNLCNGFVAFILKRNKSNSFQFASLQSDFAKAHLPTHSESLASVVLLEGEKIYTESDAVLRILFDLGGWWNITAMLLSGIPKGLRNFIYKQIAAHRYRLFGKQNTCRVPTSEEKKLFLD